MRKQRRQRVRVFLGGSQNGLFRGSVMSAESLFMDRSCWAKKWEGQLKGAQAASSWQPLREKGWNEDK